VLNPETRTVRVRMDVPNQEREYKPAMLANVLIQGPPQKKRVVPSAAVVRDENRDYVFVQTAPDTFVLRQVTPRRGVRRRPRARSRLRGGQDRRRRRSISNNDAASARCRAGADMSAVTLIGEHEGWPLVS
jgi:multidrug efflux pump subunit AcrA (membrane-fusion protein)